MSFDDEINKALAKGFEGLVDSAEAESKSTDKSTKSHKKAANAKKTHTKSIAKLIKENK